MDQEKERQQWLQEHLKRYTDSFNAVDWPWEDTGPSKNLSAIAFAEAGLHYYVDGKARDSVYCPYCNVELYGWLEDADEFPLEEHKKTEANTGKGCLFLNKLIGRKLDHSKENQYVQYESYNTALYDAQPNPSLDREGVESLSKTSDEDRAKIREQAKMVINVQERKKELARKMIAQCPICEGSEKIVVKSCRHVNCANYINCCGGFCMICGDEITAGGLIALKIRMPSRPITVS